MRTINLFPQFKATKQHQSKEPSAEEQQKQRQESKAKFLAKLDEESRLQVKKLAAAKSAPQIPHPELKPSKMATKILKAVSGAAELYEHTPPDRPPPKEKAVVGVGGAPRKERAPAKVRHCLVRREAITPTAAA